MFLFVWAAAMDMGWLSQGSAFEMGSPSPNTTRSCVGVHEYSYIPPLVSFSTRSEDYVLLVPALARHELLVPWLSGEALACHFRLYQHLMGLILTEL